ncbi:YbhB/YbcL family Raf kinase inhibitor-like protein [Krasilnikovia sp. MM14-A1259]|uniref:YbhB/YbcL family Raf kinase inhibitor-like protein n=1 Tax=Krasilnikovia sp. MM14-A1259 TaxID=3373539 RepID=UPI003811FB05
MRVWARPITLGRLAGMLAGRRPGGLLAGRRLAGTSAGRRLAGTRAGRMVAGCALAGMLAGCAGPGREPAEPGAPMSITVTSSAFADGGDIGRRHTCDGQDVSPPLAFAGLPSGVRELALLVEDPDAPHGTFVHWVAWGIAPARAGLAEGEAPAGSGTNGFGRTGYGGPCPPHGPAHRYVFTVYALSRPAGARAGATAADLRAAMDGAVLAQGTLTGRYARA